ncbi:MAG: helix-turn-helix transcriptional regulator [Thermoproteota archaeon]|nr:helix-turn-helix transcriptional regulator [Thermoproteota archaeon]MDP9016335.1 helix-turn-helix transcriptional regulator [Thermoproteota archaeon]
MQTTKGQEGTSTKQYEGVLLPQVKFVKCTIRTSLGVLSKKRTISIIRDIGFRKIERFNRLLESIPGLTPRVLSMRLKELEKEGLIECLKENKTPMMVLWRLAEKGKDTLPILLMLTAFSSKWYADFHIRGQKTKGPKLNIFRTKGKRHNYAIP